MADFAGMRPMDVWYARLSEDVHTASIRREVKRVAKSSKKEAKAVKEPKAPKQAKEAKTLGQRGLGTAAKAHTRDSLQALSKLGEMAGGRYRIVSMAPLGVPARELAGTYGISADELAQVIGRQFRRYRATLQGDRRRLLERFEIVDMARKVVGVGSVGTRAFIVLLQGRDAGDPLFLQVKEATASVLEGHLPKSRFRQPGERVVQGQRLMQAASDIYLGWSRGEQEGRFYYWRQLRDMKGSAEVEAMPPEALAFYARTCGWTLARAHARSGDPVMIAAYLGTGDGFDRSIPNFPQRYATPNEHAYEPCIKTIRTRRIAELQWV